MDSLQSETPDIMRGGGPLLSPSAAAAASPSHPLRVGAPGKRGDLGQTGQQSISEVGRSPAGVGVPCRMLRF